MILPVRLSNRNADNNGNSQDGYKRSLHFNYSRELVDENDRKCPPDAGKQTQASTPPLHVGLSNLLKSHFFERRDFD